MSPPLGDTGGPDPLHLLVQHRRPADLPSTSWSTSHVRAHNHSGSSALRQRAWWARSAITGIPSGRRFPLAFSMNTRRTGKGWKDVTVRCTSTARSIRAGEVNATCPSTPAVPRPALCCVTCRTLTSVFDQLRNIIFCRFLTMARSPAFDALKILHRSRRTSSSCTGHTIASQSRSSSSGPFTITVSNLPFGSGGVRRVVVQRLTRHTSACFRSRATRPGIRPVIRNPTGWRDRRQRIPVSCCLSATGIGFLGVLFPPRDSASLTVGLPPHPRRGGPDGITTFHTHETRPGRVPAIPRERRCPRDRRTVLGRRPPIRNGPLLIIPTPRPDPGSCRNEASPLVHARSPFRPSPHLLPPGRSGRPWASLRASHPAITDRARQRRGPVLDTDRSHVFDIKVEPPIDVLLIAVRSDRGALLVLPPVGFPGPPPEPGVPITEHRALHKSRQGLVVSYTPQPATVLGCMFPGSSSAWR